MGSLMPQVSITMAPFFILFEWARSQSWAMRGARATTMMSASSISTGSFLSIPVVVYWARLAAL